jgi:hypothetical protein
MHPALAGTYFRGNVAATMLSPARSHPDSQGLTANAAIINYVSNGLPAT